MIYYEKPISEIKVGDYVVNKDKTQKNKVVFIENMNQIQKIWDLYLQQSISNRLQL